ncbi:hypothetical protein PoB_001263600 [Plakobranchus ocellatus]|uniref:Uncharacterized protein n=1 Tax=Plakobranchus ocellatus TaxID=259542 RepID=A0AAV3YS22_9GAST|nr:hypothetical protein PoB_001263600 [Plakobranchus ocellatus]
MRTYPTVHYSELPRRRHKSIPLMPVGMVPGEPASNQPRGWDTQYSLPSLADAPTYHKNGGFSKTGNVLSMAQDPHWAPDLAKTNIPEIT